MPVGLDLAPAHRHRLVQVGAGVLAVVILVIAYFALRGPPATFLGQVEKLSIALPVLPHYAIVHVADAKGFFSDEGLDVTILAETYGTVALNDAVEGKADIGVAAEVPFTVAVMNGKKLAMVAGLASISSDNAIIARRDHAITSAQDLAGKRVGVTFATSTSYFLWVFLARHKIPLESISTVNLRPDKLVEALTNGSVDAVSAWQPISFEARDALGDNARLFIEPDAFNTTIVAVAQRQFLEGHAKATEKYVRAMVTAERFMRSHPEESLALSAQWLKVDADALRQTWKHFDFRVSLLQSQLTSLENEARWAMALGYAPAGAMPNFLPNLYLDALLAVDPERVTVLR